MHESSVIVPMKIFNCGAHLLYLLYVRLLRQIVPKWMVHGRLTCFSLPALHPHTHRVVFREAQRPDPQQLSYWSTLSLLASLHPSYMLQCHFVSVYVCVWYVCGCDCVALRCWCFLLFHCMHDSFHSYADYTTTFHSDAVYKLANTFEVKTSWSL